MSKNRSTTKGTVVKVIAVVIALLMAAYVTISLVFGSWNPVKWTEHRQEQIIPDNRGEDKTAEGSGFMVKPENSELMKLVAKPVMEGNDDEKYVTPDGIETYANSNSYTLTATITPNTAGNKSVDWAVSWNNATSTWANGKTVTDYVTVTPASDGALTATVTCKRAFGEQIKVTVTSRDNFACSAESICDYSKKITGFTFTANTISFTNTTSNYTFNESFYVGNSSGLVNNSCKFTYSDYTVNDYAGDGIVITSAINPTFKSYLTAAGLTPKQDNYNYSGIWGGSSFFYRYAPTQGGMKEVSFCGFTAAQANQAIDIAKQHTNVAVYNLTISKTGTHSTFEHTIPIYFSASSLATITTSVSLDNTSYMF